jgi:hypothetical protein
MTIEQFINTLASFSAKIAEGMCGRFYKLHLLLAVLIAFLSQHYVLPQFPGLETTGQLYAAPTLSVLPAATVTSASRVHQAWVFKSTEKQGSPPGTGGVARSAGMVAHTIVLD